MIEINAKIDSWERRLKNLESNFYTGKDNPATQHLILMCRQVIKDLYQIKDSHERQNKRKDFACSS